MTVSEGFALLTQDSVQRELTLQQGGNKTGLDGGAELAQLVPVQSFEMHSWGTAPDLIYRKVAPLHTLLKIRFSYQ